MTNEVTSVIDAPAGEPADTQPADTGTPTPEQPGEPAADNAQPEEQVADGAKDDTQTQTQPENILGDEAGDGQKPKEEKPEADEYAKLAGMVEGVKDLPVGKTFDGFDRSFKASEMSALIPVLKEAGVPAEHVKGAIKGYAALDRARLETENAQAVRAINAKAAECRQVFGNDFGRVTGYARKALSMMDQTLVAELKATPVLTNDHRFVKFLAEIGEKFATDDGTGAGGAAASSQKGFDVGRLLPR